MIFTDRQQIEIKECILMIMQRVEKQKERTDKFKRMSFLARSGQKNTQEFKDLERQCAANVVVAFDDPIMRLYELGKRKNLK